MAILLLKQHKLGYPVAKIAQAFCLLCCFCFYKSWQTAHQNTHATLTPKGFAASCLLRALPRRGMARITQRVLYPEGGKCCIPKSLQLCCNKQQARSCTWCSFAASFAATGNAATTLTHKQSYQPLGVHIRSSAIQSDSLYVVALGLTCQT